MLREEVVQQIRIKRIKRAQEEDGLIANVNNYLAGNVTQENDEDAKTCSRIAPGYKVDENGFLFFCLRSSGSSEDRTRWSASWCLNCCNKTFCIITRRVWKGPLRDRMDLPAYPIQFSLERVISERLTACGGVCGFTTAKGLPSISEGLPGNVQATYAIQMIAMNPIPSLPKSFKENT